jgi:hypothetical protein
MNAIHKRDFERIARTESQVALMDRFLETTFDEFTDTKESLR